LSGAACPGYNDPVPCDLYQLKTFFVLARTLNFTKAARKLYVTQPAVSHSLKKLEAGLGCKLIARRGAGFALTENGRLLYAACEDIFYRLDKAEESIRRDNREYIGRIRLGATVEFGTSVLVKAMKDFLIRFDNIRIDFRFSHDLPPLLRADEIDIAIDCGDYAHPQLVRDTLFREQYVVIGKPDYIVRNRIRGPRDLDRARVISMDETGAWWERFLQAVPDTERPSLDRLTTINHIRGMVNAALEGMGIALVPLYCVSGELRSGRLKNVFPKTALHEDFFYIYQKKKKSGLQSHRILVDYLKSIKPAEFGAI
jgi:DNA-binding transcriptional LysR family regulator